MTLKDQGSVKACTDCLDITAHIHSNSDIVITVITENTVITVIVSKHQ